MKKGLEANILKILEKIKPENKTNEEDAKIFFDVYKTLRDKNVREPKVFLANVLNIVNEKAYDKYSEVKALFVIKKKRTLTEDQKQAHFEKAYKKLCERYGRV